MNSKEEVLNTLETIIKNKKEAKEIWSKLQEDSKISEKSWDLSSKMFDVVSELNEELRGKLFVGNVTRGREVSKEMEGRFSSEFVYDDKYLHSFSFLGNEVKIPTYFDKHKELSFANFSLEEAVKKVTSDEFVTNLLFRREKDKVSKEKHALYSKVYGKEKELYQLDSQIKSLGTKIRFSLFNKKALYDQRIALLEQRTKVAEELAELRLAHAEKEAQEASLEGKYANYIPTAEVKEALKNEQVSRAAVDVWENEPEIDLELLEMAEISTPHIAGYSLDGKANGTIACMRAVAEKLGLESLRNWDCKDIVPLPEKGVEIIIPEGVCGVEAVKYAVQYTYNVMCDTACLKNEPHRFEELRGNYYIRREFPVFTVVNADAETSAILKQLGFAISNK